VYLCRHHGLDEVAAYSELMLALNTWQQHWIARLVVTRLFATVTGKRIVVLGFAFKADINDMRESPRIRSCRDLLEEGAILQIIDSEVSAQQMAQDLGQPAGEGGDSWYRVLDLQQAPSGADVLLLLTEWQAFAQINWPAVAAVMRQPACLFDAWAKADAAAGQLAGLNVWSVGGDRS